MNPSKIIVFGATGTIGLALVEMLSATHPSTEICAVSRATGPARGRLAAPSLQNVKMVAGEVMNAEEVTGICQGASHVFCTIGFPDYSAKFWSKHWPVAIDNLLQATKQVGAKFIFADNLYAYGPGTQISPSTKIVPKSNKTKPGVRAIIREKLEAAMAEDPSRVCVVGAADFYGPHATNLSFLGDTGAGRLAANLGPMAIGSADVVHDFCFAPDFARALDVASRNDAAYGKFWICPHAIHGKTIRQILEDLNAEKAKPMERVRVQVLGGVVLRVLGLFSSMLGNLVEMQPWWTQDYTVDDSDFIRAFGVEATEYKASLKETMDFFADRHAAQRA
eukprot:CAMPEP_0198310378 /NCGR_PEP_ID=MMETSP1450-20131203/2486_1 /TAXON_ID=753684 ORGANISM="Madagascaria erythrocladiodes, Strain CCMP3234" /NCGR_SAMPLE_ID=MMETSP1450 /ASSEMBLY_ACC=CAM_ASM_001115 /LENGTH=334 /DNA_ID=CAMNT_0044013203 /DNA_START=83 /DNA_END=1087 /DNA_ORIENTATION=+